MRQSDYASRYGGSIMPLKELFKFNLDEIAFDLIFALYIYVCLVEICAGKMNPVDVVSSERAVIDMILLLLLLPWYLFILLRSYRGHVSIVPGILSFYFFCVILVLYVEGWGLIGRLYAPEKAVVACRHLLVGLAAIIIGSALGVLAPQIGDRINALIADSTVRESLNLSLAILLTGVVVVLLCFYDALLLSSVNQLKLSTGGVVGFTFLSGLAPLRIVVMFSRPIRLLNVIVGALIILYYYSTIFIFM